MGVVVPKQVIHGWAGMKEELLFFAFLQKVFQRR